MCVAICGLAVLAYLVEALVYSGAESRRALFLVVVFGSWLAVAACPEMILAWLKT